jgi:hypothetical protein
MSPLNLSELAIEVSLDPFQSREQTPLAIALPPYQGDNETTSRLVVELVPDGILHEPIETSGLVALTRTESSVLLVFPLPCDQSGVARRVSAVLTVVCRLVRIETLPYCRMCLTIANLGRDSSIECIEIAEPIPIIELIHILDYSSLE